MNAPMRPVPNLDVAMLERARIQAAQSGQLVVHELETLMGAGGRDLVLAMANTFEMKVLETSGMLALTPAFELLPLSKAMQRHCALLRQADGGLTAVIADPFDVDLQTWLETRAGAPLTFCLALQADIHAYLSKQEESVRAVDSLLESTSANAQGGRTAAVLSFASLSEASSPAVQLVNSTLYDALKAGASDIHLESTANGLAVKYRIDGVLDYATSSNNVEVAQQVISRLKVLAEL